MAASTVAEGSLLRNADPYTRWGRCKSMVYRMAGQGCPSADSRATIDGEVSKSNRTQFRRPNIVHVLDRTVEVQVQLVRGGVGHRIPKDFLAICKRVEGCPA